MLTMSMSFSTYWQHIHIHTYIHTQAYTHTPTLNTGSVIQSVKSIWCVSWSAAWGENNRQGGGKGVDDHEDSSHVHQRGQRGERYSEKVHVPLYQLNDGYCSPWVPPAPRLHRRHRTQRLGGETKSGWRQLFVLWSKEACPVRQQDNFFPPLTYKTIAAGRARGSPSSRKK